MDQSSAVQQLINNHSSDTWSRFQCPSNLIEISDSDEGNFIRSTLIKELKSILDQYPDDGQILKVSMLRHIVYHGGYGIDTKVLIRIGQKVSKGHLVA